jgi:hypothetical protein
MKKEWDYNCSACVNLQNLIRTGTVDPNIGSILLLDVFPIEALYTRLISYEWKGLPTESIDMFGQILMEFRRDVVLLDRQLVRIETTGVDDILMEAVDALFSHVQHHKKVLDETWDHLVKGIETIKVLVSTEESHNTK